MPIDIIIYDMLTFIMKNMYISILFHKIYFDFNEEVFYEKVQTNFKDWYYYWIVMRIFRYCWTCRKFTI